MKKEMFQRVSARLKKRSIDLVSLGDPEVHSKVSQFIPTSSRLLNRVLGGGIPCGRMTEIFGAESNGKSSLVADIIAQAQKMGGTGVIIDSEQVFHPDRATAMGVKVNDVIYTDAFTVEEGFQIIETVLEETKDDKGPVVIVWDSIAASTSKDEIENDFEKASIGSKARLISKGIRRLKSLNNQNTALVIVNQVRTKIGITFGKNTDTTGGYAIKFDATIRLELNRVGRIKDKDDEVIGIKCRAVTVKNKIRNPFLSCEFNILFRGGIEDSEYLLEALVERGVIKATGAWYHYADQEKKFSKKQFQKTVSEMSEPALEKLYDKCFKNNP